MNVLGGYLPLLMISVVGIGVIAVVLWLGHKLTPPDDSGEKGETYECGEKPIGSTQKPIDIKYYIYVLLFLVIDVEIAFLIPWAIEFRSFGLLAFIEIMVFVGILLMAWAYAWKEGFLKWLR